MSFRFSFPSRRQCVHWRWLWLPPAAAAALLLVFSFIIGNFFQIALYTQGYVTDFLAAALVGWWLYALLRPWWLYLLVQTLVTGLLYMSNAYKLLYFDAPVLPADLMALPVLLEQIAGWRFVLMVSPLLLLTFAFLAGLRWHWRTPAILLAGALLVGGTARLAPESVRSGLDQLYGYNAFGPSYNFFERGPYVYLLNEYARGLAVAGRTPSRAEVMQALGRTGLRPPLEPPTPGANRNVYLIMMETLWDASLLQGAHYDRDPLAPAFRRLYDQAGRSQALVPVFGGGTPNSEFEALCGAPAFDSGIVFVTSLRRPMLCLPRLLAQAGYRTYAASADPYGLWNRGDAFSFIGFQRFYDADNFDPSDRNGEFMADAELFQQVDALLQKEAHPGPRFLFISTDSGHYPFGLNAAKRPALIASDYPDPLVTAYANAVYYDTAELADYIGRLRTRDPDALIAAFGDHLPVLDNSFGAYAKSKLFSGHEEDFDAAMLEAHQATPLLVIDGRRGPVKLGHLSLFELPRLLLGLLGMGQRTELDVFTPPVGLHPRLRDGRLLSVPDQGQAQVCTPAFRGEACRRLQAWYADMPLLRADILTGSDYTTRMLYGDPDRALTAPVTGESYLSTDTPSQACDIRVTEWGPKTTRLGRAFNPKPDGSPSFDVVYGGSARQIRAWLGFEQLEVYATDSHERLSLGLHGRLLLFLPGDHPLTLSCNGDPRRIEIGQFHVGL
jgi:phosphoglycerol transferase MdoB-like AlkP superfamily enzyme